MDSCARDITWYTYVSLRASEMAQPDMSLELWTELQAEMTDNSAVSAEQALSVRRTTTVLLYILQTG